MYINQRRHQPIMVSDLPHEGRRCTDDTFQGLFDPPHLIVNCEIILAALFLRHLNQGVRTLIK